MAAVETPPDILFSGTIKESTDGAETPEEDTRRNINNDRQPGTQEGNKEQGGTHQSLPSKLACGGA